MTTARFDAHHYAADSLEPALRHAAARATLAPSIHNTQPWRWVVSPDRLDLYADSTRSVPAVDPTGRQLAISCGAALFGARVALAAVRLDASTILLPDPGDPELLASITVTHSEAPIDQVARRLDAAAPSRHSNRRQFGPEPVPDAVIEAMTHAALVEGAWLQPVHGLRDRVSVATLAQHAEDLQVQDPAYRSELARWINDEPLRRDGVPIDTIPQVADASESPGAAQDDVPLREFDPRGRGELPATTHSRLDQTLLVLGTAGDHRRDWLLAGQALGRVLLELTSAGFKATILSQVSEVVATRTQLRHELRLSGNVQLLLRAGVADPTPATRRRPFSEVVHSAPA